VDSAKFKLSIFEFFFIDHSGLCYMGQKQALCQITMAEQHWSLICPFLPIRVWERKRFVNQTAGLMKLHQLQI
jgi:hypothetical protein